MHAIELLKEQHRQAVRIIEELEMSDRMRGDERRELFQRLRDALTLHTKLEETFFYPALSSFVETHERVVESYEEHRKVDELLQAMSMGGVTRDNPFGPFGANKDWGYKLDMLREDVEKHIDEEETELFPKAEELLGHKRLFEIGQRMEQMEQTNQAAAAGQGRY